MTNKKQTKAKDIAAVSIGNALEWYDFSAFAFFASYIGHSFFIDGDETSALIKTFLVFAVGFIARPLGALFLGLYGDWVGRKAALTLTIGLMALGTFIIAFAPPIWVIGAGAPFLLLVGRLLQGFSAGGEIGGATAFLVESAPPEKKALYASWLQASMGISNIIAALVGVSVTTIFNDETISQWAWRVPFIIGLLIVPIGWYIRKNLSETEDFEEVKKLREAKLVKKVTLASIIKEYPRHLLFGFMFSVLWTVCVYTLIIYMPTYYASANIGLGFSKNQAYMASFIGNIFMVIGCVVSGRMADKLGMAKVLKFGILVLLFGSFPLLFLLHSYPSYANLIIIHIIFCSMVSSFSGVAPVALSSIFPVAIRSTAMALSYNVAAIFFAGFTPALLTWATKFSVYAPSVHLGISCIVAYIAVLFMFKLDKN